MRDYRDHPDERADRQRELSRHDYEERHSLEEGARGEVSEEGVFERMKSWFKRNF